LFKGTPRAVPDRRIQMHDIGTVEPVQPDDE
jgi:hypothetical protein